MNKMSVWKILEKLLELFYLTSQKVRENLRNLFPNQRIIPLQKIEFKFFPLKIRKGFFGSGIWGMMKDLILLKKILEGGKRAGIYT